MLEIDFELVHVGGEIRGRRLECSGSVECMNAVETRVGGEENSYGQCGGWEGIMQEWRLSILISGHG